MFSDYQQNWKALIIIFIILAIILYSVVLMIFGAEISLIGRSLLKVGFVSLTIGLLWFEFEKSLWVCSLFRGWLVKAPDLRGRWVGKSTSNYDKKDRAMTLEVRQTFLNIQCVAFGPDNKAEGYSARLLSDRLKKNFKIAYLYHAKRVVVGSVPGDEHEGVTILEYIPGSPKKLVGRYVNDRDPDPRKADITLEWESYTLMGKL
jgi:hypothetical protein